jgi:hypothetical protein
MAIQVSEKIILNDQINSKENELIFKRQIKTRLKTFSSNQIYVCKAFFQENLIFEESAQIKFSTLYSFYSSILKEKDLDDFIVGRRKFWLLLCESIPYFEEKVKKKTQKSLICFGLQLKKNMLTQEMIREKFPNFQNDFFE